MPARRVPLGPLAGLPFTPAEARAAGVGRGTLQGKAVVHLHYGLYLDADAPLTLDLQVRSALRILPPGTVAAGATTLALLGAREGPRTLRFMTTWPHPVRRPGLIVSRISKLPPHEDDRLLAPYAFCTAATELGLVDLVAAGDRLVRSNRVEQDTLIEAAAGARGRGCLRARRAASLVRRRVDSPRETWLRLCLVLPGLPEPAINVRIGSKTRYLGKPDLVYEFYRVLLEYEGDQHRTDRRQWAYDMGRYEDFAATVGSRSGWPTRRPDTRASSCSVRSGLSGPAGTPVPTRPSRRNGRRTSVESAQMHPSRRLMPATAHFRRVSVGPAYQHSMTLTASPPRAVSLYLIFMSAPVSRMVLIALSRRDLVAAVAAEGEPGRVDRLDRGDGVALDAGDLHEAADRVAGEAEVVLDADLGGVLDLLGGAAEHLAQRPGRHRAGRADLALAADLGAGDGGVLLEQDADRRGGEQEPDDAVVVGAAARTWRSSAAPRG